MAATETETLDKTIHPGKVAGYTRTTGWDEIGCWPDDWSRWQRALDDVFPVFQAPTLEDLRG